MTSPVAIYRFTSSGDTESGVGSSTATSDLIELSRAGTKPNFDRSYLNKIRFLGKRAQGQHPRIDAGTFHVIDDTGPEFFDVRLDILISRTVSNDEVWILKRWLLETQTNQTYPLGRIGLRIDDMPIYNCTPNVNRGYVITDIQLDNDYNVPNLILATVTMRMNGSTGSAVSGKIDWS